MEGLSDEGVVAVVPTYRPPDSVISLLTRVRAMVDALVVADDASPVTFDAVLRECPVPVTHFRHNAGIARSLNVGLGAAIERGATWLLTVDQDSDLPGDYLSCLLRAGHTARTEGLATGAVAAETVIASGTLLKYPHHQESGTITTAEVFQSGTLWNVPALAEIGGFDESFGIDAVDAAACLRLRERGYRIVLAPGASFRHSYGSSRPVRLLGRTVMATGHSPKRRTRMIRNRLRLLPGELRQDPMQAWRTMRRIGVNTALAVSLDADRGEQAKAGIRGLLTRTDR